ASIKAATAQRLYAPGPIASSTGANNSRAYTFTLTMIRQDMQLQMRGHSSNSLPRHSPSEKLPSQPCWLLGWPDGCADELKSRSKQQRDRKSTRLNSSHRTT